MNKFTYLFTKEIKDRYFKILWQFKCYEFCGYAKLRKLVFWISWNVWRGIYIYCEIKSCWFDWSIVLYLVGNAQPDYRQSMVLYLFDMVIISYLKRHWCIEQSFGLCGRGRGWDDFGEWHWNMYNIIHEMSRLSRFNAPYWMLGAGALGWPRGMVWGGRREEGSGWGTHVYLWQIHFDI